MPLAQILQNPLINGVKWDFSSIELNIDGIPFRAFKSINYGDKLEPGEARGTSALVQGTTRGKYSTNGNIEIYKPEFHQLLQVLSKGGTQGYMERFFEIVANYAEAASPPSTVLLHGCRLKGLDDTAQEGGDPLFVKCDLYILSVIRDGLSPIDPTKFIR